MEGIVEYRKALVEVNEVIKVLDSKLKNKIPIKLQETITNNMDMSYGFKLDNKKSLFEQTLTRKAKAILAYIYRTYLCTEEEKQKWKEYDKEIIKKLEDNKSKQYSKEVFQK